MVPIRVIRTCAAVALKNIEIMERENLIGRTHSDTGPYLAEAFASLNGHPIVGEARSLGLIGGVEIVSKKKGTRERFGGAEGKAGPIVRDLCIQNGLMARAIRDTVVTCPPLIISHAQIDDLVGIIRKSLDEAEGCCGRGSDKMHPLDCGSPRPRGSGWPRQKGGLGGLPLTSWRPPDRPCGP